MKSLSLSLFAIVMLVGCTSHAENEPVNTPVVVAVDVVQFMKARAGSYEIELAGGYKPDKVENLDVDVEGDPSEAAVYAPYCDPVTHVCDLGYNSFPYDKTKIQDNSPSADDKLYDIYVGDGATAKHYSWEEKDGKVVFRNYQYVLATKKTVTMEHQCKPRKLNEDEENSAPEPVETPEPKPEPILE